MRGAAEPEPGTKIGPYRVERILGRGGMGVVCLARDLQLQRQVALKVVLAHLAEATSFRARFLRESELAASLDHPNVIPVYAAGEAEGRLFLAMRYVQPSSGPRRASNRPAYRHSRSNVSCTTSSTHSRPTSREAWACTKGASRSKTRPMASSEPAASAAMSMPSSASPARLGDVSGPAVTLADGRSPSTVAYWVNKHGLASRHAPKHAARGGIARDVLQPLVESGLSIREIAAELGLSACTVRHWLRKYGLATARAARLRDRVAGPLARCERHGPTPHATGSDGYLRCRRCRAEAVVRRRARVRAALIAEAGGRCAICGYDSHPAALQFHHVDPATKIFTVRDGDTRSLARMREESSKCVLLCANCHAQVEAGAIDLPLRSSVARARRA